MEVEPIEGLAWPRLPVEAVAKDGKPEGSEMRAHLVAKARDDPRANKDEPASLVEELDIGCVAAGSSLRGWTARTDLGPDVREPLGRRKRPRRRPRPGIVPADKRIDEPYPPPAGTKGSEATLDAKAIAGKQLRQPGEGASLAHRGERLQREASAHRQVALLDGMCFERGAQLGEAFRGASDQHQPRGITIEPMEKSRLDRLDPRKAPDLRIERDYGFEQGPRLSRAKRRRVHPRRLLDGKKVGIFVADNENHGRPPSGDRNREAPLPGLDLPARKTPCRKLAHSGRESWKLRNP